MLSYTQDEQSGTSCTASCANKQADESSARDQHRDVHATEHCVSTKERQTSTGMLPSATAASDRAFLRWSMSSTLVDRDHTEDGEDRGHFSG